jgi:chemotaxis protein MotA
MLGGSVLELGSIIGLVAGLFFILSSILLASGFDVASAFNSFFDAASIMIVVGGTVAGTLIAHPLGKLISALKAIGKIFKIPDVDPTDAIENIITLANMARKEGILALEETAREMEDVFLQKGVMLVVDGTDPELVRNILDTELAYIERRHSEVRGVWDYIAAAAPAWGMIGTLIGLVMMLQDLSDPDAIGPSMAVALITTFYGSIIANYIAAPVANKLKGFSADEMLIKEVLIEGILSIQAGENPRIIEEKLKAFLSPSLRGAEESGGDD